MLSPHQRRLSYLQTINRRRHPIFLMIGIMLGVLLYYIILYHTLILTVVALVLAWKLYQKRGVRNGW